ncbi:hypothetical protein MATL_G00182470 [Megalops atlanticus]|uniref:PDZ domain-containing protein n=1 Tax=Megalops atlanticus TaxID=7932 RepID=A0A9D3PRS1_MEGAT|nr:hypothetical protein MATL_G00182470 [Megalops atlanticus]
MKVTVIFGRTGVVVPCKEGWTVRDLIQQATQRYRKILEQEGDFLVRTHHVEYCDGGILDPDDVLADLVEDKDKLVAVYEEQEAQQRATVSPGGGSATGRPSPDPYDSELSIFQPIRGGEIEVNSSALKSNTPLMVRSSSDPALSAPVEVGPPQPEEVESRPPPTGVNHTPADQGEADERHRADVPTSKMKLISPSSLTKTVEINGDHGPLGIHVVPYCSSLSGRALGLHIRGVEQNSRSKREGIFQDDECIVKINDTELIDKSFAQSQEVFRQAMRSSVVRLEVLPVANKDRYEKSLIGQLFTPEGHDAVPKVKVPLPVKVKPVESPARAAEPVVRAAEPQAGNYLEGGASGTPQPASLSATPKGTGDSPLLKKNPALSPLMGFANRKGGKKLKIDLKKGQEGLGFTVVTRDSSVHGPGPILVKNILPRGAAVKDGRLQSGDRILEVNGVDITGRTQEELVAMLRSTKQGETVSLVVARQEDMFLPRELKGEQASTLLSEEGKEHLMFEIPLNDSGSAGLGVSLKGNRSRETGEDLGIFIKSIIHGGAAYKDGRLRVNDQLIAVNGESLLGLSNHDAMETLRRSMSMEGNVRGMIQLVVVRVLDRMGQENHEIVVPQNRAPEPARVQPAVTSAVNSSVPPTLAANNVYDRSLAPETLPNGSHNHMDAEEGEEEFPPPPPLSQVEDDQGPGPQRMHTDQSPKLELGPNSIESSRPDRQEHRQPEHHHVKASKSMDLVADESNVGSLVGQKSEVAHGKELGPTLGLKKSSSLESLQTAMSEVRKNELPFHRPRPHMVRGRGCNESFRAAIDKSYDGPPDLDDDDLSDQSSGRDTPASGSSRQGLGDVEDGKKDKKKKAKNKKKEKKSKGKDKDKKKGEETEEQDKKTKRKGFGLLRFGKKKEDKAKAALQKQKSEVLSEEELDKMKEERERIEAKHQELREQQARDRLPLPDVEDDDMDPNYARINNFRDPPASAQYPQRDRTPSPKLPPLQASHSREPSTEDPVEGLYAKVNKQRPPPPPVADSSADRIQQLRREYQQARREGTAPAYEELEARRRGPEYDPHRVAARGHDNRLAPRYEDVERQYASLPRRGPMDPNEYPVQPWGVHREPAHYPTPQPGYPNYPSRDNYPRGPERRVMDPRMGDPGHYPLRHSRGALSGRTCPPRPPFPFELPATTP